MSARDKLKAKMAEWQTAFDAGDTATAKALLAEVKGFKEMVEMEAEVAGIKAALPDPVRPPFQGAAALAATNDGVDLSGTQSTVIKAKTETATTDSTTSSQKAAYQSRFHTAEEVIKSVLEDLHGPSYQQKYWEQRKAFKTYLRRGDKEMYQSDKDLLRDVVMNPAMIKAALDEGWDDIGVLKATMVEASGTLGGYVVPVDFQMKIIERMAGMTIMRGRATQNTTSRDRVEIPEITGGGTQYTTGVRGKWVDETPTAGTAETNFTFGMRGVPIYTYMAETPLSRNMVEDSAFDIEKYLIKKFAESTAIDEDNSFLTGDGIGKPLGLLPSGANSLGLTRKASGGASTVTWDGLISMTYGLDAQYRQTGSVWMGNKSTYEAIAKLKDSNFGYLWQPFQYEGGEGGRKSKLLGYDTLEQESLPSIGAGTFPLIFGNPGGYHIYDRVGMTVERFLDSATARQNLVYYVLRRRLGGMPIEKWQFVVLEVASS